MKVLGCVKKWRLKEKRVNILSRLYGGVLSIFLLYYIVYVVNFTGRWVISGIIPLRNHNPLNHSTLRRPTFVPFILQETGLLPFLIQSFKSQESIRYRERWGLLREDLLFHLYPSFIYVRSIIKTLFPFTSGYYVDSCTIVGVQIPLRPLRGRVWTC